MSKLYKFGDSPQQWSETAQSITFIVTEDCNLRCKYCYISHKASDKRMNLDTAKRFIDYILTADINFSEDVIIEFFGGEPMLEMDLVDQISDYFKIRAFELGHHWYWNYRFSFATNGVNYSSPEVQRYISKNYGKVSIGISIDGTKEKHDMNRIFPDGSGSYDVIEKNIPLWISQFTPATKMTFASADLRCLKDSVIDLWNHGVTDVSANVVFEDVWQEGDDKVLEEQLCALADYTLNNHLFDKYYCTFFSDGIGGHIPDEQRETTFCGAGKMMALGPDGKIYPCVRYKDYSLNNHRERVVGTVDTGIDMNLVRPFMVAAQKYQDDEECRLCPISSGCPQCQGYSYDAADTSTNFQRAKYICKMQKARVRANNYYFAKLFNRFGIERNTYRQLSKMYFLLSDDFVTYCCYSNEHSQSVAGKKSMTLSEIEAGLRYCHENFLAPVFVHACTQFLDIDYSKIFECYRIQHIVYAKLWREARSVSDCMLVFDHSTVHEPTGYLSNCIYNIEATDLSHLAEDITVLFQKADRINVNILNLDMHFDEACYYEQLEQIKDLLIRMYSESRQQKEINLLTDLCYANEWNNCRAGERTFTYAPDGEFYPCPAFYREEIASSIGSPKTGMSKLKNAHLYRREYHPICQVCDAKQCRICIYRNVQGTCEVNVSPDYQCRKSHIERKVSVELMQYLLPEEIDRLPDIDYLDPISLLPNIKDKKIGYYKI